MGKGSFCLMIFVLHVEMIFCSDPRYALAIHELNSNKSSGLRFALNYAGTSVANIAKQTKTFVENHPIATVAAVSIVGGLTYKTPIVVIGAPVIPF